VGSRTILRVGSRTILASLMTLLAVNQIILVNLMTLLAVSPKTLQMRSRRPKKNKTNLKVFAYKISLNTEPNKIPNTKYNERS
jgi:hypothetical protein